MGNPVKISWAIATGSFCASVVLIFFSVLLEYTGENLYFDFLWFYIPNTLSVFLFLSMVFTYKYNRKNVLQLLSYLISYGLFLAFLVFACMTLFVFIAVNKWVYEAYFWIFAFFEIVLLCVFVYYWSNKFIDYEKDPYELTKFRILMGIKSITSISIFVFIFISMVFSDF